MKPRQNSTILTLTLLHLLCSGWRQMTTPCFLTFFSYSNSFLLNSYNSNSCFPNVLQHLGDSASDLKKLVDGSHPFSAKLKAAKRPLIVLGSQQLARSDGAAILSHVQQLAKKLSSSAVCLNITDTSISFLLSIEDW